MVTGHTNSLNEFLLLSVKTHELRRIQLRLHPTGIGCIIAADLRTSVFPINQTSRMPATRRCSHTAILKADCNLTQLKKWIARHSVDWHYGVALGTHVNIFIDDNIGFYRILQPVCFVTRIFQQFRNQANWLTVVILICF